jgi:LysR family hydrogen peroxide-inducible transcriptional activator
MNLRDLKYLVAVAELRNFSQAAERCFVSQPTLSTQIKKMEDELGVVLFERTPRSVRLTEAGESILAAARRILAEVDLIGDIARSSRDPLAGTFRLGAFPTLASYFLPQAVPLAASSLPKLKLLLIEEKTEVLVDLLRTGRCDAALLALPVNDPALVAMKLFADPFLLALPENHPWAGRERVEARELADLKLLLLDEGHCLRDQALDVCYRHGGHEEPDFRATSLETLREMVRAGTGITLMPRIAARQGEPGIRYVPFADPAPQRLIGFVYRKTTARGLLIGRLEELLKTAGQAVVKENPPRDG